MKNKKVSMHSNQANPIKPQDINNKIQNNPAITPSIVGFLKSSCEMTELVKRQFKIFNQKLANIEKSLNKFFENDIMKLIKEKICEHKSKIANEQEKQAPDPTVVGNLQNELKATIHKEKLALECKENQQKDPMYKEKIRKLENAEQLLVLGNDMKTEFYEDEAMVRACAVALNTGSTDQLRMLEVLEQNLGKILIKKFHDIEQSITTLHQDLPSKSHIELDISNWQIQGLLKDARTYFHTMTSGFEAGHELQHCIAKLNESMTTLIGIYDRIDSYIEKQDLANYIANISSSTLKQGFSNIIKIVTNDENTDDTIQKLKKMIKTNIIMEEYEVALNAFNQYKFPFAPVYMKTFELPQNLQIDDFDGLKQKAMAKIDHMKEVIEFSNALIQKYDQDIINVNPLTFYIWKYEDNKDDISKLLSGEEIIMKADIAKGLNQNAVKFKEIGIHLKLASELVQRKFNATLELFNVVMTMVGSCYYRCGKRSYSMSVDDNIVIEFSMKKDKKRKSTGTNDVYRKILAGEFFLSPYTMWSIKLCGGNFKVLDEFKSEAIDIHLIGNGQYLKNSSSITNEIPYNILDKHYNFDSVIMFSNENTLIENA